MWGSHGRPCRPYAAAPALHCRVNIPHTLYSAIYLATLCNQMYLTTLCSHANVPDHNSRQQLGLSHSLLLVSAAPGHFVWSHQWHQICTAERQPLVGGRQGRGQQQWPGWTLFSLYFSSLYVLQPELLTDSQTELQLFLFLHLSMESNGPETSQKFDWLRSHTHTHMVIFPLHTCDTWINLCWHKMKFRCLLKTMSSGMYYKSSQSSIHFWHWLVLVVVSIAECAVSH